MLTVQSQGRTVGLVGGMILTCTLMDRTKQGICLARVGIDVESSLQERLSQSELTLLQGFLRDCQGLGEPLRLGAERGRGWPARLAGDLRPPLENLQDSLTQRCRD